MSTEREFEEKSVNARADQIIKIIVVNQAVTWLVFLAATIAAILIRIIL